jgi:hypothetical protein
MTDNVIISSPESVSVDWILISVDYFYCPYWLLNVGIISLFVIGVIYGFGCGYGWKRLYFAIQMLILRLF